MNKVKFMALGGAQSVGSSCYYLKLGASNVMLDCGVTKHDGDEWGPALGPLIQDSTFQKAPMLELSKLNHIYVSHAHADHVGYLDTILGYAGGASVYMTPMTKILAKQRLEMDADRLDSKSGFSHIGNIFRRCQDVGFLEKINHRDYSATFYEAGHIPGAMMTLLEYKGRKILYTGDYSVNEEHGLSGCVLPDDLDVDLAIICAVHAKHPDYRRKKNWRIEKIMNLLKRGTSVYLQAPEPSKILEQLQNINSAMEAEQAFFPVYLEPSVMPTIRAVENLQVQVMRDHNYVKHGAVKQKPHVIIGTAPKNYARGYYWIDSAYSLHEDFPEMCRFIKRLNPRQALMVHCGAGDSYAALEQELRSDPYCRTKLIFPEEGILYEL